MRETLSRSESSAGLTTAYPERGPDRDRWIVAHRPPRNRVAAFRPYAVQVESERAEDGAVVPVAIIFLTNRECHWRCLMCDLWKNTLPVAVPGGAIVTQIDYALKRVPALARSRHLKLYNSGSFFDPRAIPPEDQPAIARHVCGFERVIVESHPALVGQATVRFRNVLAEAASRLSQTRRPLPQLEVAMGLETAHPDVLRKLNKHMSLDQFARAAEFLRRHQIALRAFVLVKPPFLDEADALRWAGRSLEFAFDCGAAVAVLIPTRPGNGALEALAKRGEFSPPRLATLEAALDRGIGLGRGRVFADLWEVRRFAECPACFAHRIERLKGMNLRQQWTATIQCTQCGAGTG
jgi:radical SAM enzyme (TIGR01210 family)